jgi:hypothetical protein
MVSDMQQAFGDVGLEETHGLESVREVQPGTWKARCLCSANYARTKRNDALSALSTLHLTPIVNHKLDHAEWTRADELPIPYELVLEEQ